MNKFKVLPLEYIYAQHFYKGEYRNASVKIIPKEINKKTIPSLSSLIKDGILVCEQAKLLKINTKNGLKEDILKIKNYQKIFINFLIK